MPTRCGFPSAVRVVDRGGTRRTHRVGATAEGLHRTGSRCTSPHCAGRAELGGGPSITYPLDSGLVGGWDVLRQGGMRARPNLVKG